MSPRKTGQGLHWAGKDSGVVLIEKPENGRGATSLVAQWLRVCLPGDMGSIPGPGTKMPQLLSLFALGPMLCNKRACAL